MAFWNKYLHTLIVVFILAGVVVGAGLRSAGVPTAAEVKQNNAAADAAAQQADPAAKLAGRHAAPRDGTQAFGFYLHHVMDMLGDLFIAALKMVIVPVIVVSIAFGLGGMSKGANVGRIATRTILYYLATTGIAVTIGLILVSMVNPGKDTDPGPELGGLPKTVKEMLAKSEGGAPLDPSVKAKIERAQRQLEQQGIQDLRGFQLMFLKLKNLAVSLMPTNAVKVMADGQFLPLIVFSIILGATLLQIRERVPIVLQFFEQAQELFFAILNGIMLTAPIGFFALVGKLCWEVGIEGIASIWVYGVVVLAGLLFHGLVVLPTMCMVLGRRSPLEFAGKMKAALIMAFSTASSSATLPVTLMSVEEEAGIKRDYASFVLPLGSTVNMDGTAIYESIALITLATAYAAAAGIPFNPSVMDLAIICITVTMAAVGAAGVPGAGIFMLIMLMTSIDLGGGNIGVPPELIGLIIVLDRPLDMVRTCINVWGDSVGCVVVSAMEERSAAGGDV